MRVRCRKVQSSALRCRFHNRERWRFHSRKNHLRIPTCVTLVSGQVSYRWAKDEHVAITNRENSSRNRGSYPRFHGRHGRHRRLHEHYSTRSGCPNQLYLARERPSKTRIARVGTGGWSSPSIHYGVQYLLRKRQCWCSNGGAKLGCQDNVVKGNISWKELQRYTAR